MNKNISEQDNLVNADINSNVVYLSDDTLKLIKDHVEAKPYIEDKDWLIRKALSELPLEKEAICNCCGLTCKLNEKYASGNYGLSNAKVMGGYASTPGNGSGALDDLQVYEFSLCEFCCDWLFTQFKVPVLNCDQQDGVPEKFRPASERVTNDDWRGRKEEFFAEKHKRDVARGK